MVRELLIGLCSVLLSYILTTTVSGVVCWCRTNFNTGTYQLHFSFPPLSVEIMGHYSIAIMNRRSTHHFFLYIDYFRLPSGLFPLEPKWYHYTNTLLWIHIHLYIGCLITFTVQRQYLTFPSSYFMALQIHCLV